MTRALDFYLAFADDSPFFCIPLTGLAMIAAYMLCDWALRKIQERIRRQS